VAARAHRGVIAEEYLAAHNKHNDPNTRVKVLLAELTATLAELVPLVDARDQLYHRLAQEYELFPAVEKNLEIPRGRPITAPSPKPLRQRSQQPATSPRAAPSWAAATASGQGAPRCPASQRPGPHLR
jgi:hypothetical protein